MFPRNLVNGEIHLFMWPFNTWKGRFSGFVTHKFTKKFNVKTVVGNNQCNLLTPEKWTSLFDVVVCVLFI